MATQGFLSSGIHSLVETSPVENELNLLTGF